MWEIFWSTNPKLKDHEKGKEPNHCKEEEEWLFNSKDELLAGDFAGSFRTELAIH